MRYLGIDWGEKRIGLALGDDETGIASPLGVVDSLEDVIGAIGREGVEGVVLGRPTSLAGGGGLAAEFEEFRRRLRTRAGVAVEDYDERLSSKAADRLSGAPLGKGERDAVAAMVILQDFLDSRQSKKK